MKITISLLVVLLLLGAFSCFALLAQRFCRKLNYRIRRGAMPSDMMNDLRRNFEVMLLGSTRVWGEARQKNLCSAGNQKEIVFSLPTRTVEGDWLVLQRMHSYVRKGGVVLFPIDLGDPNNEVEGIGYAELNLLHPVTLDALNICVDERRLGNPILHYNKFTRVFLYSYAHTYFFKFLPQLASLLGRKLDTEMLNQKIQGCEKYLRRAADFCQVRSIHLVSVFILPEYLSEEDRTRLSKSISESYNGLDYNICRSPKEALELSALSGK